MCIRDRVVGMLHDIVETHVEDSMLGDYNAKMIDRAIRSQEKLVELIEAGDGDAAETHWRGHIAEAARVAMGKTGRKTVLDLFD